MRSIFIFLSFVTFWSFAQANEDANLNSQYEKAVKSYKANDFSASYELLSKLYLTNLSDANLNFYLGRSAYETGHYEVALAAFERVETLDDGNLRNKLEMARTYFMLKMYEDSEMAFRAVLQNPNIPQNVRTNIELYLSKVTKVQQKSFTYATVNMDWIHDSNVNYGSLDNDYNINVGGGILPVHSEDISDNAIQAYGDVTNVYDVGEKNGFAIKNKFIGLIKDYNNEDDYDIQYLSYTPSLIYGEAKHLIELAASMDNLHIAKQNYLNSFYVMPRYEFAHTTTLRSITYFKYQEKDFKRATEHDLDAKH